MNILEQTIENLETLANTSPDNSQIQLSNPKALSDVLFACGNVFTAYGVEFSLDSLLQATGILNLPLPAFEPAVKLDDLTFVHCKTDGKNIRLDLKLSDFCQGEDGTFQVPDDLKTDRREGYVFDAKGESLGPFATIESTVDEQMRKPKGFEKMPELFRLVSLEERDIDGFPFGVPFEKIYPSVKAALAGIIAQPFMPE